MSWPAFRTSLQRKMAAAEAGDLTTVEKQRLWGDAGLRPCPVMVWLPEHTGRFLDYLDETGERLSALFCLVAYCGLRRRCPGRAARGARHRGAEGMAQTQSADKIAWGPDWPDTGLVFTREDGTAVPARDETGNRRRGPDL